MTTYTINMSKITEVIANGKEIILPVNKYIVDDKKFCKENNFIECSECREYFDEIWELGIYHPDFNELKQKNYCHTCFHNKYN